MDTYIFLDGGAGYDNSKYGSVVALAGCDSLGNWAAPGVCPYTGKPLFVLETDAFVNVTDDYTCNGVRLLFFSVSVSVSLVLCACACARARVCVCVNV